MTATTDLDAFWGAWPLFQDAILTGTCAGVLLGVLGVYVVLGRMVFLTAALSQTAGLGVTLAFAAQIYLGVSETIASSLVGASVLTLGSLLLIWNNQERDRFRRDSMLGLLFLVGSAGTLVVSSKIVQELHDVQTLLFGSSVAVLPGDFRLVFGFGLGVLCLHLWCWRGFVEVVFDQDTALIRGIPVQVLKAVLLVTVALSVSLCTRVLGALPSFAFSVFPAMAAVIWAPNIPRAMGIAAVIGGACGFLGYLAAFLYEVPVGPSQALVGAAIWCVLGAASWVIKGR